MTMNYKNTQKANNLKDDLVCELYRLVSAFYNTDDYKEQRKLYAAIDALNAVEIPEFTDENMHETLNRTAELLGL
jgi:hypothetical protein